MQILIRKRSRLSRSVFPTTLLFGSMLNLIMQRSILEMRITRKAILSIINTYKGDEVSNLNIHEDN